jgi:hypothetical protein
MHLCIIGIGGCGRALTETFLENQDVSLLGYSLGDHISFGGIRGLWLEADVREAQSQKFFKHWKSGKYPLFIIPYDFISSSSKTSNFMKKIYGYDLKPQGFVRKAEEPKAIFEIFEKDRKIQKIAETEYKSNNPILSETWSKIRPFTVLSDEKDEVNESQGCDVILFVASLGGGTGTGLINPMIKYIKNERRDFPIFVLGVLTQTGYDEEQKTEEPKRALSAIIATYDFLTQERGKNADALIIIDNEVLKRKLGQVNYRYIDPYIFQAMKPLLDSRYYPGIVRPGRSIREKFVEDFYYTPILVPCYAKLKRREGQEEVLIQKALNEGMLFACDPSGADKAFVFIRGYADTDSIKNILKMETRLSERHITIWENIGNGRFDEILILLRNPFKNNYIINKEVETIEKRLSRLINLSLDYMGNYRSEIIQESMPPETKDALREYFFGPRGLRIRLSEVLARIEDGKRPYFNHKLEIFDDIAQLDNLPYLDLAGMTEEEKIRHIAKIEIEKALSRR